MADDFVELGLEGLNRFADKYHDKLHDTIYHRFQQQKEKKGQPRSQSPDLSRPRTQSEPGLDREGDFSDSDSDRNYDYSPRKRRERVYRDDEPRDRDMNIRDDRPRDRDRDRGQEYVAVAGAASDYYGRPRTMYTPNARLEYRGREIAGPYDTPAYQAPFQPPTFAPRVPAQLQYPVPCPQTPPSLEDSLITARRRQSLRTTPRSPSYSPPGRSRTLYAPRSPSPRRRRRSKSPPGKGFASSVVGALAGGWVGNELNKGDTFTTVAAAVIGAVGAREAEKKWDKRKEKEKEKEESERWERRWERERR